ncbi:MAG: SH3 beta-barrel fold-containing protein [Muribaculaceae bacterium]|nr:SH3 beta-barrel fold-containing protein [Muribaculaceae bacterium]MDE7465564.1 SH3 beta-barrel fold-containing protein [Muribaculaceae bacterium]
MEKKNNFRMRVMKYAWQLRKATKQAWRSCMLKAWELYRLAKAMREGEVAFIYKKADGSARYAHGTLKNVPAGATFGGKRLTKPSYKTMSYFDTDKQSFRCFKVENLIAVAWSIV